VCVPVKQPVHGVVAVAGRRRAAQQQQSQMDALYQAQHKKLQEALATRQAAQEQLMSELAAMTLQAQQAQRGKEASDRLAKIAQTKLESTLEQLANVQSQLHKRHQGSSSEAMQLRTALAAAQVRRYLACSCDLWIPMPICWLVGWLAGWLPWQSVGQPVWPAGWVGVAPRRGPRTRLLRPRAAAPVQPPVFQGGL
jgi:hypothetical protein